jgi:hypothetical protein
MVEHVLKTAVKDSFKLPENANLAVSTVTLATNLIPKNA